MAAAPNDTPYDPKTGLPGYTNLALEIAPIIKIDSREPFPFTDVAVTTLPVGATSPSTGHQLTGPGHLVTEYALWTDVEIGHAYELEHIWIHTHKNGTIAATYGSAHGDRYQLTTPEPGERPYSYSEPGKHGNAPSHTTYQITRELTNTLCDTSAGTMGVHGHHDTNLTCTISQYRQAWNHLRNHRFTPAWDADTNPRHTDTRTLTWTTWPDLEHTRTPRALAAIKQAPTTPINISTDTWGSTADAWTTRFSTRHGTHYLGNQPAADAITEAQHARKLIIAIAPTSSDVEPLTRALWEHYASAHTLIVSPGPAHIRRAAALAVPPGTSTGTSQLIISPEPRTDTLTIGPGGDYNCSLELLTEHGYKPEHTTS